MASQQRIHICFYSNRCPWSKAFIEEISKTPWKQEFQYVCVDPGPNRPQLPKWLEKTPTLVIRGEKEPRIDAEVMNWLYERKMKEPSSQQQAYILHQALALIIVSSTMIRIRVAMEALPFQAVLVS
jgi:hypothetical protein